MALGSIRASLPNLLIGRCSLFMSSQKGGARSGTNIGPRSDGAARGEVAAGLGGLGFRQPPAQPLAQLVRGVS